MLPRLILALVLGSTSLNAAALEEVAATAGTNRTINPPAGPADISDATGTTSNTHTVNSSESSEAGPVLPADNSIAGLQLRTGLRLQLAAKEPDVISPVAMAFDARGRLFVAEVDDEVGGGRIKLLQDEDGDGVFEKSGVFAGQLAAPSAIICYGDGLFVASGNQILFLADTNADNTADVQREVFAGFKPTGATRDAKITQLAWGVDNWIHAACDGIGGKVVCTAVQPAQPLDVSGHDFMFNPRTLEMWVEPGGDSRAVAFDSAGRRYTSSRELPLQFTLTQPWLAAQNPLYEWPRLQVGVLPANNVLFPLRAAATTEAASSDLIRSRYATNGYARPSSLFIYRGGMLPKTFDQALFLADPELRLISCYQVGGNGTTPLLARSSVDRTTEFLAARDPRFRPVQIIAAPDGSLLIADLSRTSLDKFEERGRIWRLLPTGTDPVKAPDLAALPSETLIPLLGKGNAWVQDTAARLLFERLEVDTLRSADKELRSSWNSAARLRLLYLLAANNVLPESSLLAALQDADDAVRESAVRLASWYIRNGECSLALLSQLAANSRDPSPRVRFHLALTLAGLRHTAVPGMLSTALSMSPADSLLQSAVLTGANVDAAGVFMNLVGNPNVRQAAGGWGLLRGLASMAGLQGSVNVDELYVRLNSSGLDEADQLLLTCDVGDGLFAGGRTLFSPGSTNQWRSYGINLVRVAIANYNPALRAEAIRYLGICGFTMEEVGDWIVALMVPGEPVEVQLAAVNALAHFPDPSVTTYFAQRWSRLTARVQVEIIARMLERFDRTEALMSALELGRIPLAALTEAQVNFLRFHRDPTTAARARRVFGPLPRSTGTPDFSPVLKLKGSEAVGRRAYLQLCSGCHEFGSLGREVGPRLDAEGLRSETELLRDILEPSRSIAPGYETQVVRCTNNQLLYGMVRQLGGGYIGILQPDGKHVTLPGLAVEEMTPQEWSFMPANTAVGLSFSDLASLVAFLKSGSEPP